MTTLITYAEVTAGVVGLFFVLFTIITCIQLIIKTAGKLRKAVVYFLISAIPGAMYLIGRLINIESILIVGKFINLVLAAMVSFFVLIGLKELKKIVDEISSSKTGYKYESKPKKEAIPIRQEAKPASKTFVESMTDKYLDLTGRKPKLRA